MKTSLTLFVWVVFVAAIGASEFSVINQQWQYTSMGFATMLIGSIIILLAALIALTEKCCWATNIKAPGVLFKSFIGFLIFGSIVGIIQSLLNININLSALF